MKGSGSGWRRRRKRKRTVEQCLPLKVNSLPRPLPAEAVGSVSWERGSEEVARAACGVREIEGTRWLTLTYGWRRAEEVVVSVRLQATPMFFGGCRWWLTCPLVVDGVPCLRRVGSLYLPPGEQYFGCRHCHRLTYRSNQRAHYLERHSRRLGCDASILAEELGWD